MIERPSKETFTANFYCKNCGKEMNFRFPVGTSIVRAPYLGYDNSESRAIVPGTDTASEHITLKCKYCKVGNVA